MSRLDELNDLEESVSPAAVRSWLATQGWALTRERPDGSAETWSSTEPHGIYGIREVMLPLRTDFVDYVRRFKEVLSDIRMAYGLDEITLIENIAAVSSDMFFVRVQQESMDSTIPFQQATELLGSIHKMVRAAATSAANPRHSHRGRRPAAVSEFMDEDLRFGHTKRGSFIMTVAARLPNSEQATTDSADDQVVPFQRQVMQTLAEGLKETKRIADSDEATSFDVDDAATKGVSLELVQSVLEVADFEGLQQVDLSFDWARKGPPAPQFDRVVIKHSETQVLETVRGYLARSEPVEDVTLIGRVAELSRETVGAQQEEMSIVLEAELLDRMRRVKVPLIESDYEWAIYAHQHRLPFTVSGTPIKKRSWQLGGIVKADTTFLREERNRRGN